MADNSNPPADKHVTERIEGVKTRLASENVEQKIVTLSELLKYGQAGVDLVIQALQDESWQVQHAAFLLLKQRSVRSAPHVKDALRNYMILDGQYPEERQEVKNFLSNYSWITENDNGYRAPPSELLQLMKWGEVLIDDSKATGYRLEGVYFYIVDFHQNQKIWRLLSQEDNGTLTIPLKFLQKKGYSYYLNDLLLIEKEVMLSLPVFKGKETLLVYQETENNTTFVTIHTPNNVLTRSNEGKLIKEEGKWFILAEQSNKVKLPIIRGYYRIPKKYLALVGYSYYHQTSQMHQIPLIGYLSPKEYLDFLNLHILDFLSLKPTWNNRPLA